MWKLTVPFVVERLLHAVRPHTSAMVCVVRLSGPITDQAGALSLTTLNQTLESTYAMRPACVVLQINCPGGSVVQSLLLAKRIRSLAKETGVPTLAFAEDVEVSGGACTGENEARLRQLLVALHEDLVALVRTWRAGRLCSSGQGDGDGAGDGQGGDGGRGAGGGESASADATTARARAKRAKGVQAMVQARRAQAQAEARAASVAVASGAGAGDLGDVGTGTDSDADADVAAERIFSGETFADTEALMLGLVNGLGTMHEVLAERFQQNGQLPEYWYVNRKLRLFPSFLPRGMRNGGANGSAVGPLGGGWRRLLRTRWRQWRRRGVTMVAPLCGAEETEVTEVIAVRGVRVSTAQPTMHPLNSYLDA